MHKTAVKFFLSSADVGVEKYSTEQIAELMKYSDTQRLSGLYEFGLIISQLFDDDSSLSDAEQAAKSKTMAA